MERGVGVTAMGPLSLAFSAETADANAVMAALLFTGLQVGAYEVQLSVANSFDTRIAASAVMALQVTSSAGATDGTSAASTLPFNALYLWITVGVVVGLILALILFRRCYASRPRGTVLTNEERHILQKAQAVGRVSAAGEGTDLNPAEDAGGRAKPSSSVTSGDPPSAVQLSLLSPTGGRTRATSAGFDVVEGRPRAVTSIGEEVGGEDVVGAMTAVCLANVNLSERSHLGSRLDSEMWGHFGELQQQRRGLQLQPTGGAAVPFDPYATGVVERYEGTEPVNLHMSQTLSSTLGLNSLAASQLIVLPADASDGSSVGLAGTGLSPAAETTAGAVAAEALPMLPLLQVKVPRPLVLMAGGGSGRRLRPLPQSPRPVTSSHLPPVVTVPAISLRDTIRAPTLPRKGRVLSRTLTLETGVGAEVALPQAMGAVGGRSPAHSDRTGPRRRRGASPSLSLSMTITAAMGGLGVGGWGDAEAWEGGVDGRVGAGEPDDAGER